MELNRQQKAGMVIAALAVAALGVDRFVLGSGGPATASAQADVSVVLTTAAVQLATTKHSETLAGRLDKFAAQQQIDPSKSVPDLFGSEEVWTVSSLFGSGNRAGVRIGEKIVRVGQVYRGATLVRVSRQGATFSKAGREIFAPMDRPMSINGQ